MATTTPAPASHRAHTQAKPILWTLIALAFLSVILFTEIPLATHPTDQHLALAAERFILIPHGLAGLFATCLGPFLFSTRFRSRHLKRHRIMGRVYVISVAVAAPTAILLGRRFGSGFPLASGIVATCWLLTTLAAFLTARNRQIPVHRQWMIRSYIFTLHFVTTRLLNPIPAYFNMSDATANILVLTLAISYFALPQLYFNWHELTTSRAH